MGLVESVPGRFTRVSQTSSQDALLIYPLLTELHGLAAVVGTPRATAADIGELETVNDALLAAARQSDARTASECDDAFHDVFIRLADNPFLTNAIGSLRIHTRRLDTVYYKQQFLPTHESYLEHKQIIAAVSAGDPALARERTRVNWERSIERLEAHIQLQREAIS